MIWKVTPLPVILHVTVLLFFLLQCNARLTPKTQPTIFRDSNNIFGLVPEPKHSTKNIKYLGDYESFKDCERACTTNSSLKCTAFTWHHVDFDAEEWAKGCYGNVDSAWAPSPNLGVDSGLVSGGGVQCKTDLDCSLNGECDTLSGSCTCEPAWKGPNCETLNLIPTPFSAGYRYDNSGPQTSWGGASLQADDGKWHMWAAELVNHCPMSYWLGNSQVVHAVSNSMGGPYIRQEVVQPVFAHEPNTVRAPTGEYVMYFTARSPPPNTAHKPCICSSTNYSKYAKCDGSRDWNAPLLTYMSYTSNPNGNWSKPVLIPQAAPLIDSNLAPVILSDGSVRGIYRDDGNNTVSQTNLHIVTASNWRDPSTYIESSAAIPGRSDIFDGPEDPFVWQDKNGNFHAIFHEWPHPAGPHAFSKDGKRWYWGPGGPDPSGFCAESICAYHGYIQLTDRDKSLELEGRERPHLIFGGKDGNTPVALTNGVCDSNSRKNCWTALQFILS